MDDRPARPVFPLDALLRSLPDAVLVGLPDGTVVAQNAAAGNRIRQLQELGPEIARWLADSGAPRVAVGHLDGPVEVSLSSFDHEGSWVVAICRDITERTKAEEADRLAFQRLLEIQQLRETNRFKTQFLNAASHELNTPITPVKIQLHLLSEGALGPLTEGQQHALRMLRRNVDRLATLVDAVLDVGRIESGRFRMAAEEVDLATIVNDACQDARIDVHAEPSPLIGDADRLRQMVDHLIQNAWAAAPTRVVVRVAPGRLEITDDGQGYTGHDIQGLFQPFVEAGAEGRGLGLYLARAIARAHGGALEAHSGGPGKGATFVATVKGAPPTAQDA